MSRTLIVGLGNPGKEYENTRHNVGFMVVDALAKAYQLKFDGKKSKAKFADGMIKNQRVMLVKPQTYMNASGQAVRGLMDFYNLEPSQLIVVTDHMDIPLGNLRIRPKGGAGGQKGVRDIINQVGTQDFARIRFGVGRPPGKMAPSKYVLRPVKGDDAILLKETIERAVRAIEDWLVHGIEYAMNRHNGTAEEAAQRFEKATLSQQKQESTGENQDEI